MPLLKSRKLIYTIFVIPSVVPWAMMSLMGITLGVGILGFAGIYGFRSIWLLPIKEKKRRRTYNILLSLGIIPMAVYVSFMIVNMSTEWTSWVLLVTGSILLVVAIFLLFEINHPKNDSLKSI
ncbi:MAG: hypothetical protein ISR69_12240 [Gammaproteobacteria bacterium]|nr:hypothetical protein [Gammaproteobacteria bacterium]